MGGQANWVGFDKGWRLGPARGGAAERLVILLHGVGDIAAGMKGLAQAWAEHLPDAAFTCLDGTQPFDGANEPAGSYPGRQWFSLRGIDDNNRVNRVEAADPAVADLLNAEARHWRVGTVRIALVGFSQGATMALHLAATKPTSCGLVLSYAGRLASWVVPGRLPVVVLVHGDRDDVSPIEEMERAAAALREVGRRVTAHVLEGVGHAISDEGVEIGHAALAEWVRTDE